MAELVLGFLFGLFSWSSSAEVLARMEAPSSLQKSIKSKFGGLSGLTCTKDKFWAVSDDRGKFGPPRMWFGSWTLKPQPQVQILEAYNVLEASKQPRSEPPLIADLEAITRDPLDGGFWLSSEGDQTHRPRVWPQVFKVDPLGKKRAELDLPMELRGQKTGMVKRGFQGNAALESLQISPNGLELWGMAERPLVQDLAWIDKQKLGFEFVRIFLWTRASPQESWKFSKQWVYPLINSQGLSFFGVSEFLMIEPGFFVVLERGLKSFNPLFVDYAVDLVLWDLRTSKSKSLEVGWDLSGNLQLKQALLSAAKEKTKLWSAEGEKVQNFEALCKLEAQSLGLSEIPGVYFFMMASDDNFSKREKTEFVWLKLNLRKIEN